jgi:hypothetical protein
VSLHSRAGSLPQKHSGATKRHGAGLAASRHDGVASFLHENSYVQKTVTSNTHHPLESG